MWRKLFKNEWLGSRFCILFTLFLLANTAFAGVRLVRTGETYEHLSDLLGVGNSQLQDNDVLELDSDMDVDFPFAHFTAKNVTLRGNGYMLRYKEGASSLKLTDAYLLMENVVIDGSQLGFVDFPIFVLDKNSSEGSYLKLDDKTIVQGFQCGCLAQVAWSKISGGVFRQNSSVQGGLAMFDLVDATIASTKIIDNEVSAEGDATLVSLKSSTMVNSIVANNHISTSGTSSTTFAIRVLKANAGDRVGGTLINSTVVENGANLYAAGSCLVHNNILYHNGGEIIISGTLPADCMTGDPHLYDDYTLMSTSPCIDKGNNQPYQDRVAQGHFDLYDYFGEARIEGGKIDIGASEYRSRCGDVGYMDQRAPVLRPGKFLPTDRVGEMVNLDKIPDFPSVEEIAALFIDDCSEVLVDSTMEFEKFHNCDWEVKAIYTIRDAANNESMLSPLVITYSGGNPKIPVVVGELPLTQRADVTQCVFSVPDFREVVIASLADDSYDWEILQEPVAGSVISEDITVKITVSDHCGNQIDTSVVVLVPQPLKLTVVSTEANCFGLADGEIKGTIQGGTAPYQLTWTRDDLLVGSKEVSDVDLNGLADGMYKLTIRDANGCQKSVSVNIAQLTQTIIVKAADSSKVYDGEPLVQHRYEVTGLLEEGDRVANVEVEGTISESGRVENVVKSFQILRGEQDVTCFYDTVMKSGSLVVSKRKISLLALSKNKDYDGTALVLKSWKISNGSLADGENLSAVEITGSIINVGVVANKISGAVILRGEQDVTSNYDIDYKDGRLEVLPKAVKVTVKGATKEVAYSGAAQKLTGYEWRANSILYQAADFSYAGDSIAEGTEIGTYAMNLKKENFTNKNDNYTVTFEVEDGWLKIDPLAVTVAITGHTRTAIYNGFVQDTTGYEWRANSILYQAADFSYAGDSIAEGTEIGTYAMNLKKENFTNKNDNYTVTFEVEDGWLKIDPLAVTVTITGHTRTTIYNGSAQDTTGYEWSASSILYQAADFSYEGDSLAEGTEIGTYAMNLTEENFTNNNDNYTVTFEVEDGWLKIDPLAVTVAITGHTRTTIYNGSAQDTTGYEWRANTKLYQASDFSYEGDSLAKGTEIGNYAMNLKKENFANNNNNYTVTFEVEDGWLKINPLAVTVTITGHTRTTIYNGFAQDTTGYEWSANTMLYQAADFSYEGDSLATGAEIGTYAMNLKRENFTNNNDNYTVTFEVEDGWLKIDPLAVTVTITGHTRTAIYNGFVQDTTGYEWSANTKLYQASDFSYEGDSLAKGTEIGTYAMNLKKENFTNNNDNYTVTFEVEDGWLKIDPLAVNVSITGHTKTTIYNGASQDTTGYEWSANTNLYQAADFSYAGDSIAAGKEIGTYQMKLSEDQFTNNNPNYNVTFEVADGWLKINPLAVKVSIAGHTRTTIYNGASQDTTGYEWSANSTLYQAADFSYVGDSIAAGKEIGTYQMKLSEDQFTNNNPNYNVTFEVADGWLKINPLAVKVSIAGHTRTTIYNGFAQDTTGYEWSANTKLYQVADFSYEGDSLAKGTEIGTYAMNLKKENFANNNDNYTVTFEVSDGWLKIAPLAVNVSITGHTKTTIYNGASQDTTGYEWSANSTLYQATDFSYAGDSIVVGINVGTYNMSLKEEHFSNVNPNFEVVFTLLSDGKLEITPLDLSVDIIGHTKVVAYSGVVQKVTGYDWTASTSLYKKADFSYAGDSLATGVTLGTYPMELSPAQFSNQNPNFGKVVFRVVSDGYIQITPITTPITITANSSKAVYDGSPFSDDGFKYTRNVLVAGDVLKAVVEGTIKNVGETANVVTSYRVVRIDAATKEEVDVTENYTFTDPENGKLTVTKRAVLLRSASDTKVYDGKALTNAQVEVVGDLSVGGFVFGEGAAYDVTGSITEVGSADNLFTYRLRSNTLAENYDIQVEYGTLTVTLVENSIVITANSQSKLYDGEPLFDPGFTFTPNVLAKGDVIEATVVGEVTAVGSVANRVESFKVVRGELDVTKNYTFGESKEGILTVTPRQVILTSATDSKPYDRQPLVNGQVKIGGDGFAKGEGATFQVTGSLTEEGSVENSFTYVLTENTVSTNYLIQSVTGLLTVTPRPTAIVLNYGYAVKADTLDGFADKDFESPADPLRKGYAFESWKPALPALLPLDTLRSVAQWRLLEYKVALDTFGQISYTVEDHATIDLADYTPSRIGYDFTGWVDEKGYSVDHVNTSEARSIALKATWRMANYAIHYLSAGKEWKQVPMTYGETIAPVAQPVRNGYLFKGWIPALPTTMPNKDLTVEADWEIIHYSLMLVDEGRDAGTLSYTVEDDDFYLDKLADRPGQEFSGWTMAGELLDYDEVSGQYIFHPSEVASDAILEATWTIVSNEFTIDFYVDGAKYKTLRLMAGANTASYIATVRDPRDKAGYRFGGWDMDLPEEMPRKNLEVSAVWKPISYKLILLNEQGVETYLTNYTIEDEVLLPNFEDPEGKREFLGWTDGKNYYKTFDPSKFLKDVELVESWKLRTFQVIYFVSGKEYARDTFHVGDSIMKIPDPEDYIEGYAFSGWSETPTYMPTEDVKVTSYYELGGYTLTYKSEGKVVKSVRYLYQAPISPSRGISKYGYEFKYWAGVPSNMPGRDIEVEAVYDVATYRLVLRDGTEVIDSLHYTIYDEDIKLPVLEARGRVFRGWYDGTKTITTVKKGSYASNMDLVANWTYINYTLIFMVEGVEYKKKNTMRCGDEITLPKEPVKEGAEFIRWEGMPTDGLMPDDDLILTAVFSTQVGETLVAQSPTVELYSADLAIHILHAEGKSVTVMDLNGLILFEGKSSVEDYVVPVRRHGAYLVRVDQEVKKILVK